MVLSLKLEDKAVRSALGRALEVLDAPRPMLMKIGEELADSTMARFPRGKGPDGVPWARKSPTTLARHPRGGRRPLIGESRVLSNSISHQVQGKQVMVGSSAIQAAVLQMGAKAGSLWKGKDQRGRRGRSPWGDIPARPYLGLSDEDEVTILDVVADYLDW